MFHEPPTNFLYSAYRINAQHADDIGNTCGGVATGFILETAPLVGWLVTNRHVVDSAYRPSEEKCKKCTLKQLSVTGRRSDDSTYTFVLHPDARILYHSDLENDVALVETRFYQEGFSNEEFKLHWHFGLEHLAGPEKFVGDLQPFDLVCYTGFPDQRDKLGDRPIIRSGHIASDPKFNYSWDNEYRGQCVAYEGFSMGGSSGSPVFAPPRGLQGIPNSRHGYLVGVNAGHVKHSKGFASGHSGVSFFYKSTVILEILEQHGLLNIKSVDQ